MFIVKNKTNLESLMKKIKNDLLISPSGIFLKARWSCNSHIFPPFEVYSSLAFSCSQSCASPVTVDFRAFHPPPPMETLHPLTTTLPNCCLFRFRTFHISGITHHAALCVWLFLFRVVFSELAPSWHVSEPRPSSLLKNVPLCDCVTFSFSSPVGVASGCGE